MKAKCEVNFPLDRGDDIESRLGLQEMSPTLACVKRGRHAMKKVQRMGRWMPPQDDSIKINTDGSFRGDLGPAGIGRVGRDNMGEVVFFFLVHKGWFSNKFMKGLAIFYALEHALELGWQKVICKLDSQITVNLLIEKKVSGIHW